MCHGVELLKTYLLLLLFFYNETIPKTFKLSKAICSLISGTNPIFDRFPFPFYLNIRLCFECVGYVRETSQANHPKNIQSKSIALSVKKMTSTYIQFNRSVE